MMLCFYFVYYIYSLVFLWLVVGVVVGVYSVVYMYICDISMRTPEFRSNFSPV